MSDTTAPLVAEASTARTSVVVSVSQLLASLLGALLAVLIAVIEGEGAETDGFLAAYSAYLLFILFGSTLRIALVPLLGSTADAADFRVRAAEAVSRLLAAAGIGCAVLLATSALLGRLLVPEASSTAQSTAAFSIAILSVAAYFQIWSAALSAVLGAVRRFASSALFYLGASAVSVSLAAVLMAWIGIEGAAIAVLAAAGVLLAAHAFYLRRFSFSALPAWRLLGEPGTWRLAGLAAAGASVPVSLQLATSISLAAVSDQTGAVTAYSYSYFITVLATGITAGVIGLVTMPALVRAIEERGREVAEAYLLDMAPFAAFLYLPLAAGYCVFGWPLLDAVLSGTLSPGTLDLLWDASRIFLLMGVGWALLSPLTTLVLSLRMYVPLAVLCAGCVVLHVALVLPAASVGPVTVAGAQAVSGTALVVGLLVLIFGRQGGAVLARALRAAAPAALFALVFPLLGVMGLEGDSVGAAVAGLVAGSVIYLGLSIVLWPSVGGRALQLLRGRA